MLVKDVTHCEQIIAGDKTELREILHPDKDHAEIRYSLAHATLHPGQRSVPHRLRTSEACYFLYGTGVMHINDETRTVHAGQCVLVPPGATQWLENAGRIDLAFLCIVDPAWKAEAEEILG